MTIKEHYLCFICFQLKNITIAVKEGKRKKGGKSESSVEPKSQVEGLDQIIAQGRNIQANQSLKQLMKLNKKKRKRAGDCFSLRDVSSNVSFYF